jgi:multiple sugar transport system ATP-binding protein
LYCFGPTGAGKTTTLRIISGLTKQDAGSVLFDSEAMDALPPADRDVAYVFQQYSLYPTMTVYDNLAFPLRSPMRDWPEPRIKERVTEIAEVLRISHLLERKTAKLSGGEMQRVSIGRAIVRRRMFLMDEPLSIWTPSCARRCAELAHLTADAGAHPLRHPARSKPHDGQPDRCARSRKIQVGTDRQRPAGDISWRSSSLPRSTWCANCMAGLVLRAATTGCRSKASAGRSSSFRPRSYSASAPKTCGSTRRAFAGSIILVEPLGVETILHIKVDGQVVICSVPGIAKAKLGDNVRFDIQRERLHLFDSITGARLNV